MPAPTHTSTHSPRARSSAAGALLLGSLFLLASTTFAQRPGGGGGGGMGGGGFGHPGFPGGPGNGRNSEPGMSNSRSNEGGSSGLLGPSGRWWDDKDLARNLGIDSKQQHRMDEVFSGNRSTLVQLYKNFQHEQEQLSKLVRGKELDETQIFAQIDRVTQARGELEKANAHMLLQIRKEMTPEQTAKLNELLAPAQ